MKWVIYQMVTPNSLKEISHYNYSQQVIYREVLEKLDVSGVEENHRSMESAIIEIKIKKDKLKHLKLTILPIFEINYEGNISYIDNIPTNT